jgi:transketolase
MQKLNVKIVGIGAGLAYNKAGPTHHSMEDIALMRTLPGMTIIAPVDTFETEAATEEIAKQNGPCYLRLERNPVQSLYKKLPVFRIGKGREIIKPAGDRRAVILATGTKIGLAREALEILKKKKIFCPLYAFPTIVPLDSDLIDKIRAIYPILITIEEHRMNGGFGTAVMEYLAGRSGRKIPKVVKIGLKDEFTPISADYNTLMKYHGMMPGQIADKIAIAVTD